MPKIIMKMRKFRCNLKLSQILKTPNSENIFEFHFPYVSYVWQIGQ